MQSTVVNWCNIKKLNSVIIDFVNMSLLFLSKWRNRHLDVQAYGESVVLLAFCLPARKMHNRTQTSVFADKYNDSQTAIDERVCERAREARQE